MINRLKNPDGFHYSGKKCGYFEGWYFKFVDKNGENPIAIIPGIITSGGNPHSFIQVFVGDSVEYYYIMGDKNDFIGEEDNLNVKVKGNTFTLKQVILNIKGKNNNSNLIIEGKINLRNKVYWPDNGTSKGSMGFFNYLTFLECYSQVCLLNSEIDGTISINGKEVDYTDGKAYVEKNWGRNFPKDYLWIQSSGFTNKKASLTISYGRVPLYLFKINGFLGALYLEDKIYTFTTMNKSKINIDKEEDIILVELSNKEYYLRVRGYAKDDTFFPLIGPFNGNMKSMYRESLKGSVETTLIGKIDGKVLFNDTSNYSGIEVGGDLNNLK